MKIKTSMFTVHPENVREKDKHIEILLETLNNGAKIINTAICGKTITYITQTVEYN